MVHRPKERVGEKLLRLYRQYVSRPVSGQLSLSTPGHEDVSRPVVALASMDAPSTAPGEVPPQVVHSVAEEVRKVQLVVVEDSSSSKAVSTVGLEDGGSIEAAGAFGDVSDSLEQQVNDLSLLDAGGGKQGDGDGTVGDERLLSSDEDDGV